MTSKNRIKFVQSLHSKKFRYKNQLFIVEGVKIINELLISSFEIESIYAKKNWAIKNISKVGKYVDYGFHEIEEQTLRQISTQVTPNEVLALVKMPEKKAFIPEEKLILMLDGIQDPGNLGTIIRTADWYGIKQILCSKDCTDLYNPKCIQATMGSIFRVSVYYEDLCALIKQYPEYQSYGAFTEGEDIRQITCTFPMFLIVGNEGSGINKELKNNIQFRISIARKGQAESLNAAIASAIILDNIVS
jgi:RNA methyltransferase, TrmH family